MSLKTKINAAEEKNSVLVYDCTGEHSHDNKTGYGGKNIDIDDVTGDQLEIYPPDVTVPVIVNVFPDFPSTDEFAYEIQGSRFGYTIEDGIKSGVWRFVRRTVGTYNGVPFEKTCEKKVVFLKKAECCVDNFKSNTANVDVQVYMKDDRKKKAVEISNLLEDARWAKECGKFEAAQKILSYINKQCRCCS